MPLELGSESTRRGPGGGVRGVRRLLTPWRWGRDGRSAAMRCRGGQWYALRAVCAPGASADLLRLDIEFLHERRPTASRTVTLQPLPSLDGQTVCVGWFQTPAGADQLVICLPEPERGQIVDLGLRAGAERDTKSHPAANVPRWSTCQPPFALERVLLPASLERLAALLSPLEIDSLATPRNFADLQRRTIGAAAILDPAWIESLRLTHKHILALAANSWLIVDLESLARRLTRAGIDCRTKTFTDADDLMSARVEYADVETRGFALQDVMPYSTCGTDGFSLRVLRVNRAWRHYATDCGFASLLSSETPWREHHGDVVAAARVVERGELIASDAPWLVAGDFGPPAAPQLMRHVLRMQLGCPLDDAAEYWNRWEEDDILVRDIADVARRYPLLQTARWASRDAALAHLGLTLAAGERNARRHFVIHTGRMDARAPHDGLPAEPMLIFMKHLVREAAEQTVWAQHYLKTARVTWQFDTSAGVRYAYLYQAAPEEPAGSARRLKMAFAQIAGQRTNESMNGHVRAAERLELERDEGLYGDRSIELQIDLSRRIRAWIESCSA